MSSEAVKAVAKLKGVGLGGLTRGVLFYLAFHYHPEHGTSPSRAHLALQLECTKRHIFRLMEDLVKRGLITHIGTKANGKRVFDLPFMFTAGVTLRSPTVTPMSPYGDATVTGDDATVTPYKEEGVHLMINSEHRDGGGPAVTSVTSILHECRNELRAPAEVREKFDAAVAKKKRVTADVLWKYWRDLLALYHQYEGVIPEPTNVERKMLLDARRKVGAAFEDALPIVIEKWKVFAPWLMANYQGKATLYPTAKVVVKHAGAVTAFAARQRSAAADSQKRAAPTAVHPGAKALSAASLTKSLRLRDTALTDAEKAEALRILEQEDYGDAGSG